RNYLEQLGTVCGRNARRRFVKQQDLGLGGKGQGNLDKTLLAIRKIARDSVDVLIKTQRSEQHQGFLDRVLLFGDRTEPVTVYPFALADGEYDRLKDRQPQEQGIDLECAGHAHLYTLVLQA